MNRSTLLLLSTLFLTAGFCLTSRSARAADAIEQWGQFELTLKGRSSGNPFVDTHISIEFSCQDRSFVAEGFYDGDGTYRVRCMPDRPGEWRYETHSNDAELN